MNMKNISFETFARTITELLYGDNEDMKIVTIQPTNDKFALVYRGGAVIREYSRRRDAVRGAERLGLTIA